MKSTRGLFASVAFLLALPLAALCQMVLGSGFLAYRGMSLDVEVPLLKILWLMPFVWLLCESATRARLQAEAVATTEEHA